MSKFLELVEENTPGTSGVGPFTVEYKDARGKVLSILTIPDSVGSSYDNFLDFARVSGGSLEVVDQPVEDAEGDMKDSVEAISAIASLPDQGFIKGGLTKTGRRLKRAKSTMASAAEKIAKKFDKAAG